MSGDPQLSAHYLSVGLQKVAKKHCIHLGMGLLTMGFTVGWSGWPVSLGNTQGKYLLVFSLRLVRFSQRSLIQPPGGYQSGCQSSGTQAGKEHWSGSWSQYLLCTLALIPFVFCPPVCNSSGQRRDSQLPTYTESLTTLKQPFMNPPIGSSTVTCSSRDIIYH